MAKHPVAMFVLAGFFASLRMTLRGVVAARNELIPPEMGKEL